MTLNRRAEGHASTALSEDGKGAMELVPFQIVFFLLPYSHTLCLLVFVFFFFFYFNIKFFLYARVMKSSRAELLGKIWPNNEIFVLFISWKKFFVEPRNFQRQLTWKCPMNRINYIEALRSNSLLHFSRLFFVKLILFHYFLIFFILFEQNKRKYHLFVLVLFSLSF